jgi:hypothetical protein
MMAFNDGEAKKKWGNFSQGTEPQKKMPQNFPDKMSCQTDGPKKPLKKG